MALERQTDEKSSGSTSNNSYGHAYDLRPKVYVITILVSSSIIFFPYVVCAHLKLLH